MNVVDNMFENGHTCLLLPLRRKVCVVDPADLYSCAFYITVINVKTIKSYTYCTQYHN